MASSVRGLVFSVPKLGEKDALKKTVATGRAHKAPKYTFQTKTITIIFTKPTSTNIQTITNTAERSRGGM